MDIGGQIAVHVSMLDPDENSFVTIAEASELTGKEIRTVRRWVQRKKVTAFRDGKNGEVMIQARTLPGFMSVAASSEGTEDAEEKQLIEETTTREQSPEVAAALVNIRSMSKLGLFTDSAHKHIDQLLERLLARDDSFVALVMKQNRRTMKENARLHKQLRKATLTEEKLLDGEVTRTLAIEDYKRGREQKKQILTIVAALGLGQLGDEKMAALSKALGTVLSGGLPSDLAQTSPPQSAPPSDQPVAPSSTEIAAD